MVCKIKTSTEIISTIFFTCNYKLKFRLEYQVNLYGLVVSDYSLLEVFKLAHSIPTRCVNLE